MKLLRVLLVICLCLYLVHISKDEHHRVSSTNQINSVEKIIGVLPPNLTIHIDSKVVNVRTQELGLYVAQNLTVSANHTELNKKLTALGADTKKSSIILLTEVAHGNTNIYLVSKPAAPKPPAPKPQIVPAVPDYVAPTAPVGHTPHTYTYCVATRGVDPSNLPELQAKLASVYSDARGWSLGGINTFVPSTGGCNLTVWLTAADQMPSFGAICDSMWSCTVYPNVILNFDRWRYASPAWTGGGGNLDDYRTMVINHETGHWLGFGHRFCSGAGQLAPVMQQQSISLQGCALNPWPLEYEKAAL
jgi:hypothetical protein